MLGSLHVETNYLLAILLFARAQRETGERRPLVQLETSRLMLPARRWKRPLQLNKCGGGANRSSFTTAKKYLFADLLLFTSGKDDEETSTSFAPENVGIDACSSLLQAPIAPYHMQGNANGSGLPTANKYLLADLLLFKSGEDDEETSTSFAPEYLGIDASSALLEALIAT